MNRGSRVNVLKTKNLLVFIDFLAGNGSGNNLAKNAVFVIFHGVLDRNRALVLQKQWV
jgi:hypothetical protein